MEKLLPHNIEAERGVLGSLIIDPEALDQIADKLTPDDFYRESHRAIYQAILTITARHEEADYITIQDELERTDKPLEDATYLIDLTNAVPTSGNVAYYAAIVARTALDRRIIHAGGQVAAIGYGQMDNGLDEVEKLVFALGKQKSSSDFSSAGCIVDTVLADLFALQHSERSVIGVPTGFTDIDSCLGGLQRSDLIILAGRPSMGKTSLMLSVAYNAALRYKQHVGIFSLEMSKVQLVHRLLSYETKIPLFRLRNGQIEEQEWDKLETAGKRLNVSNLQIEDTGGITLSALRSKARRLKAKQGLDLLIVDYLQLMHASSEERNRNREREVAEISSGLKEIAKELDLPVLALAQLSRAVESRQSKIPQLSDLRESGSIENDADVVMFIYRDDYYAGFDNNGKSLSDRPGTADIVIAKHRNGPIGNVSLAFRAAETRFSNLGEDA